MKRQISKLQPYPLMSDFELPEPAAPDRIALTQVELAALLEQAREGAAELVRNDLLAAEAAKLADISAQLQQSLAQIVTLAAHLENAHIAEIDREVALDSVRKLASTLLDGQGELFLKT